MIQQDNITAKEIGYIQEWNVMHILMLIRLFDGAPSVPRDTQIPASIIFFIGANPSIRIAAAGQWETLTPAFER